jgi:hypothetical protein
LLLFRVSRQHFKQKSLLNALAKVIPTLTILGLLARPSMVSHTLRTTTIPVPVAESGKSPHVVRNAIAITITTPIPSCVTPVQRRRSWKFRQQKPGANFFSCLRKAISQWSLQTLLNKASVASKQ